MVESKHIVAAGVCLVITTVSSILLALSFAIIDLDEVRAQRSPCLLVRCADISALLCCVIYSTVCCVLTYPGPS